LHGRPSAKPASIFAAARRRLPILNEELAAARVLCQETPVACAGSCVVAAESLHSLLILLIGFASAGVLGTGYQLVTTRPASFNIFGDGTRPSAIAHVPFLVFAAPFIIMRNTVRGCQLEGRNFVPAMLATVIAGFWSLMSGTVVVMAFESVATRL
jgi:hypothetical protein